MFTTRLWSKGDFAGTVEINISPQETFAQAALCAFGAIGDSWDQTQAYVGIRSYRTRPHASGADHEHNVGVANYIHDTNVSSVTFGVGTWPPFAIEGTATLFFQQ
jgi:hypothetical protein